MKEEKKYRLKDPETWARLCAFPGFEKAFQQAMRIALQRRTPCLCSIIYHFCPVVASVLAFPLDAIEPVKEKAE